MKNYLAHKRILLGVTGSIAAYKSADLVRRLREVSAIVRVAMTDNAKQFITPLTMQAVSGHPVHDNLFDLQAEAAMGHIELARWADILLIAPGTADFIARLAKGQADDLLTAVCLATKSPIAIAPAMNQGMWHHALTQENLQSLQKKGVHILGPAEGSQACGDIGPGRMLEPSIIINQLGGIFATGKLAGLHVLITAGPTHEAIDPVRFISNGSSGKMGYALCEAAKEAGAKVTLISGPVEKKPPTFVDFISVESALEMYDAVMKKIAECDIFLAVAAVSDYRCQTVASQKMHKTHETLTLTLTRNPDIVESVGQLAKKPFIVGFAAETEEAIVNAKAKRVRKQMDMIIANKVGGGLGIGSDENQVTILSSDHEITLPCMPKNRLARELLTLISDAFKQKIGKNYERNS